MRRPKPKERTAPLGAPIVFLIFTVTGALYIVIAKLYQVPAFAVTVVPVALMLTYALMIIVAKGLRLRDDQTGDNFYYMGFIFTLTSLAVSLYQYSSGGSVDEIVRNFGIAVASTIAGISLRIAFNQMRRDPVEVEHYSRLDLADASNKVRRELDGLVGELAHFRRTNQEMLAEGFEEIRHQVSLSTQKAMSSMETVAREAMESVRDANAAVKSEVRTGEFKQQLDETMKNLKRVSTTLSKSGDQIGNAAQSLATKLSSFSPPDRSSEFDFKSSIDGLQNIIKQAVDRLEALSPAPATAPLEPSHPSNPAPIVADQASEEPSRRDREPTLPRPTRNLFGVFWRPDIVGRAPDVRPDTEPSSPGSSAGEVTVANPRSTDS